ncbi:MAG: C69 family dipeptidase [Flavobacteriales bacterium]|nr:C69 family dipeptidase [Flavobacteriales bacterium]
MCTTILITKGATIDGSIYVSHSDDDDIGDQRMVYVPAADHPAGSMRPVYKCSTNYPRVVTDQLGPGYNTSPEHSEILGYIPQVEHTYAYFDGNYGIMNEHQLAMGECTDAAQRYGSTATPGKRLFYSSSLSRVALERCKTAREAIRLMGSLIEEYGYYDTGETLLVADKEEGWVFEMCATEDQGDLWVAQRVPDGEVFVAANEFRIRDIDPEDPNFMFCSYLWEACEKLGWYDPSEGPLDWCKTVSFGEYNHPYYSLRRVWSCFNRINPSLKLSPWVDGPYTKDYPFSIKPEKPLSFDDVRYLHRDQYQGTEFDMTKGLAAGPYGDPNRLYNYAYDGSQKNVVQPGTDLTGAFERPVSVYYCGYSFINHIRPHLPDPIGGICWFGPDQPMSTCYVPFYAGIKSLPASFQEINPATYDPSKAFWKMNFVANWARLNYAMMIEDIKARQSELEKAEIAQIAWMDERALDAYETDPEKARAMLTDFCHQNAATVLDSWTDLSNYLIQKYASGFVNNPTIGQDVGYSKWWRDAVGYQNGPVSYEKPSDASGNAGNMQGTAMS